ncbi:hypothetical protein [Ekhidna sp.]
MNKRIKTMLVLIGTLLFIPLIAMQFTSEINWDFFDFLIMGTALLVIGFAYELIARRSDKIVYRSAFIIGLMGAFLLFWVNGAVGIIGSENQKANLLYGLVLVIGVAGAIIVKFKAAGMSKVLTLTTIVQMLIPCIALIVWPPPATSWAPGVFGVFLLSAFFAALFFVSAMLFKQAAR